MSRTKHDVAFDLEYYTDHGPRAEKVYMVRHAPDCNDPDPSFSVVRFANDMNISTEDTKADAIGLARCILHQWADLGVFCPAMAGLWIEHDHHTHKELAQ